MNIQRNILILIIAALLASRSHASDRKLTHVAVIDAPVADVWRAFIDPVEMKKWMVAEAKVDLQVGGAMTTSYVSGSTLDDEHTIVNRILSYEAERMLSIQNVKAPAAFENANLFRDTWSVIYFEPIDDNTTRARSVGLGYGRGPEWDDIYTKFEQGNTYVFQSLQRHFGGEAGEVLVNPEPATDDAAETASDRQQAYPASVAAANSALRLNDVKSARKWLNDAPANLRGWEWKYLDAASDRSARTVTAQEEPIYASAVNSDGPHIAILNNHHGTDELSLAGEKELAEPKIASVAANDEQDDVKTLQRTIELLHQTVGGEWIHEGSAPDGSAFLVRNVLTAGPDGASIVGHGWLGSDDGMFYHGATLIHREPGTNRIVFHNINEHGALAAGEIKAIDDHTLQWEWNATELNGNVTRYDVRTVLNPDDPDTYQFILSQPTDDRLVELVNISYKRVNEAPERFRTMREH